MAKFKPSRVPPLICMLVALCVTGCTEFKHWMHNDFKVGPNYFRPVGSVAREWIDFNDPQVISDSQDVNEGAWWQSLNDPVLDQLVNQAHQQNLTLRAAGMRVLEAQAQRAIAAGLFYPQFQQGFADFNHIQVGKQGNAAGISALPFRSFDLWSSGFNVGWELDVWGKFRRNLESADANLDATIENHDDILVILIAETAAAYVEMRAFEQRLTYARSNAAMQQQSLEKAKIQFRLGAADELDVNQTESNLAQTEALIPLLEKGHRLANNRLCVLLGTPPRDLEPEFGPAPIPLAPPQLVVGIPAELIRRRPDVRREERKVAEQSARIGIATAELFPAFTINGSINWQANKFGDMFDPAANAGFINPAFNWNILNYGRLRNRIRSQEAAFQALAIEYQNTVLTANAEVEDGIVCFLNSHKRVTALRRGVEASRKAMKVNLAQEAAGNNRIQKFDYNRLFNLQATLVQQQDELAAAEAEIALSLIRTYKALGGGWQIRFGQGVVRELSATDEIPVPPAPENPAPEDGANDVEKDVPVQAEGVEE